MEAASQLRTTLPVEAARSFIREGPGPLARDRMAVHVIDHIRGALHEEAHMITIIFMAVALLAMSCTIGSVNMRQHFAKVSQHRGRR